MLAEKSLIARVRRQARNGRGVATGIGDDCAVLCVPPGHQALITTDFSLEGVHFRRKWHSAESVGHRCLARGLSDIAAMGGVPIAVFVSLALPRDLAPLWVDGFANGLLKLASRQGVSLAGGDTAQSPGGVLADVMVVGSVPKGRAILRSGARAGDRIYVSGKLGGSAATLGLLLEKSRRKLVPREFAAHFFPEPRIDVGKFLQEKRLASAMIDISDGLSTDLAHICEESEVGAEIQAEEIPLARIDEQLVNLHAALHGGEDYELLFTSNKRIPPRIAGIPITQIGEIRRDRRMILINKKGVPTKFKVRGWEHFKQK
jgi:thiamine-monophosphate kinase